MGCAGCSTAVGKDGKPRGCKSNGGCGSGGCNKLNTYDWLTALDIEDTDGFDIVEVSFKNGGQGVFSQSPAPRRDDGRYRRDGMQRRF